MPYNLPLPPGVGPGLHIPPEVVVREWVELMERREEIMERISEESAQIALDPSNNITHIRTNIAINTIKSFNLTLTM